MNGEERTGGGASRSTEPAAGTSTATDVSIREFIMAVRRGDILTVALMALGLLGFGAFAWGEIQRRLEILNHENARLLAQQEKTVSQDTYTANEQQRKDEQTEYKNWKEAVDKDRTATVSREEFLQDNRQQRQNIFENRTSIVTVGIAALVAIIIVLTYIAARHNGNNNINVPQPTVTITHTSTLVR